MNVLFVSDTHFENHNDFNTPDASSEYPGCGSRMLRILEAFQRAVQYGVDHGYKLIVMPGDIFHRRGVISVAVFNAVSKVFEKAGEKIRLVVIPGNHDLADKVGSFPEYHSLFSLRGITVFDKPTIWSGLGFVPYTASAQAFREAGAKILHHPKAFDLVVAHQSFEGAVTGPHEYVMREGLKPDDFEGLQIVSGHYHKHQILGTAGNIVYVGGLIQHNFGERDYTPGWLVYDTEKRTWKHVEDTESPRFVLVRAESPEDAMVKLEGLRAQDYVQIVWTGKSHSAYQDFQREVEGSGIRFREEMPGETTSRIVLTGSETLPDMLEKYVVFRETEDGLPDISRAELLEMGRRFMEEGVRSRSV